MAGSNFNIGTSNQYISGKLTWVSVSNGSSANSSNVTAVLTLKRTNPEYTGTTTSTGTFTIEINGTPSTSASKQQDFGYGFTTTCHTFTLNNVPHNADGKKSISIRVWGSHSRFNVPVQSGTAVLDTIPRASSLSAFANFTVGNTISASISRASSSFTHTLMLYVGSTKIGEWTKLTTGLSVTPTAAQLNALYGAISTSATVTMRCYTYSGTTAVGSYTTRTATATVANASTISTFGSFTIGNDLSVVLSRGFSAFTHTIMLYVGNIKICEREGIGTSTTLSLSVAEQNILYSALYDTPSGTVTLRCYSYHGTNYVRSYTTKTATASVASSIVPTFTTFTAVEDISAVLALGVYVQNLSRIKFTVGGVSGAKGSTVDTYQVNFNGVNHSSPVAFPTVTTDAINRSGELTATATITDSRGRKAQRTLKINLVTYSIPKITSLSVVRCNSDGTLNPLGTSLKVITKGSVSSISSKNTMQYRIKTAPRGTTIWTTKKDVSVVIPTLDDAAIIGTYSIVSSYDLRIELVDKFNTTLSFFTVRTGEVTMSWGKAGIGVGKIWEKGALDVAGDTYLETVYPQEMIFPPSQYWLSGSSGVGNYAMDLNNSDIIGLNNLVFTDDLNSVSEGLQFPKSGKGGSTIPGDYDNLRGFSGELLFNGSPAIIKRQQSKDYNITHYTNFTDFFSQSGNVGQIMILLAGNENYMFDATIKIRSYNIVMDAMLSGYTYIGNADWHMPRVIGRANTAIKVTFTTDTAGDGERYIVLGEPTTNWSNYLQVSVTNMNVSNGYQLDIQPWWMWIDSSTLSDFRPNTSFTIS